MKMITKGLSDFHIHTYDWFFSQIVLTSLKYETQCFRRFRKQNRWVLVNAVTDSTVTTIVSPSPHQIPIFLFKNSIIIILIQVKKDFESLTVVSVEYYWKINPACLNVWKWLTIENIRNLENSSKIIKCNQ